MMLGCEVNCRREFSELVLVVLDDRDPGLGQARDAFLAEVNRVVEADRKVPGQLNAQDGTIASSSEAAAGMSDVLDDVAEEVLRKKGEVIIVPAERMPSCVKHSRTTSPSWIAS